MRISSLVAVSLLPLLGLAGCQAGAMGDVKQVLPLAGGGTTAIQLTMQGPVPGEADGYRATMATAVPTKQQRTLQYDFGLRDLNSTSDLTRIQIVDLSDDVPEPLIDDQNPTFNAQHEWTGKSEVISADDPRVKWMYTIPLAFRVYRFTLTHRDGKQAMFYHAGVYPQYMKSVIRTAWGEKY